jgi:Protein of unknown function (DUF3108)
MRVSPRLVVQRAIVLGLLFVAPARAQDGERPYVPFAVGERLEYDLKFGKLKVGVASMEVANIEDVRGHDAWHTVYQAHGGVRFLYSVDDVFESWIDRRTFNSLRFKKDQNEGRRDVQHTFEIYPERAEYTVGGDSARASVHSPLDDGSFLYFVRTIPLVVGQTYTFERYFIPDRNPVTIKVVRKDTIDVPAGRFSAIVIQPIIKTPGIFSEKGHAEIWLSDDKNRIMLQFKSSLSFGSINLYLTSYRPAPAAPAAQTP